ncbi:MAG TPA: RidA family protein [Solirubrobacteraceae bacterium]|nr:RidA family protein [Solirubrobacteraceae bacterium]
MTGSAPTPIDRFSSGAPWEPIAGYSRTVRAGDRVLVAGTTATLPDGEIAGPGDAGAQTRQAIVNVEAALALAGATLADVVRTRIYVTDISRWEDVARAHGEAFGAHPPVTTMVQVAALIDPRMLVEIEAEAVTARRPA